jgi:hypothetical protein
MRDDGFIKTVGRLEKENLRFIIPPYQRGYRWTEREIVALLVDVNDFNPRNDEQYCLQPLILQKRDEVSYEVVDGQQRLTTIYVFMKVVEELLSDDSPKFELMYETRSGSEKFLQSLTDRQFRVDNKDKSIDYSYIVKAYDIIYNWLEYQAEAKEMRVRSFAQRILGKFETNVFFIWYVIREEDNPNELFTKVNVGKIPLTDSELIKALLMNKSFYNDSSESAKEYENRTAEISSGWDRIEQHLQNDSFWFFLQNSTQKTKYYATRIDLLFNLLAKKQNTDHPELFKGFHINPDDDPYYSFYVFSQILSQTVDKPAFIKELWDSLQKLYFDFSYWYSDLDLYHTIGFLIASGKSIFEIHESLNNKSKSEFNACLRTMIKNLIVSQEDDHDLKSMLQKLSKDKKKQVRDILLLFNIATVVNQSKKQYRFSFDLFKQNQWDIEHIHATGDPTGLQDDLLWNLTLLDSSTNREYKNATFDIKRNTIIKKDAEGKFIPLCTMNVFLKNYTHNDRDIQMNIWDNNDKEVYLETMAEIFTKFFEGKQDE